MEEISEELKKQKIISPQQKEKIAESIQQIQESDNIEKEFIADWESTQLETWKQQEWENTQKSVHNGCSDFFRILYWLILESLEEVGHLKSLSRALSRVNRFLFIHGGTEGINIFQQENVISKQNWHHWDHKRFSEEVLSWSLKSEENQEMEAFLCSTVFHKYELVVYLDWVHAKMENFPVYLRLNPVPREDGKVEQERILNLDLYELFRHKEKFLQRAILRLQKNSYLPRDWTYGIAQLQFLIQAERRVR